MNERYEDTDVPFYSRTKSKTSADTSNLAELDIKQGFMLLFYKNVSTNFCLKFNKPIFKRSYAIAMEVDTYLQ